MSEIAFIVGQRWISNSEAELGLGIIKQSSGRQIEVFFPAVSESRFYAADNAPLSRVVYSVGEQVATREQVSFTISALQPFNGCYIYQGETGAGEAVSFHEMDLDSKVHFNQPQDRLFAGQVDKNSEFELRSRALAHQHALFCSPAFGLLGGRVQLLPHQLYIAHEVSQRHEPRVLLADEVGLGKTIEAGLILHQKILAGEVKRGLIIVPDALLHQWLVEMLRRFNLSFTLIDDERYLALGEDDGMNPFDSAQLVLTGINTLMAHPEMQKDCLSSHWDMLIVDEAHHLQWSENAVSDEFAFVSDLAASVASLILLTATPEQLGSDSHFARLHLLDPDRFHDLAAFREQEASYQPISDLIDELDALQQDETTASSKLIKALGQYLSDALLSQLQQQETVATAIPDAIRQLLDHHGTGRVLFRNTRDVVKGFPRRILEPHPLEEDKRLEGRAGLQPEKKFGADGLIEDLRVSWLLSFLESHRGDKVLLICADAETVDTLEQFLRVLNGVRCAAFHENMSLINRDRAAAFFADDEAGAQILLCSEIGSEGRNFQFCHHLVLFDLPAHPDLLEQRIGRLDRIGQQHDVVIHVPYYQNSAQQVLFDWYREGLNAFEQVFAAGDSIVRETGDALAACLAASEDDKKTSQLIKQTRAAADKARASLQSGRNRLLERHSFDERRAQNLLMELEEATRALELADFMEDVFDIFGLEQQPHSSDSIIVQPGNHMLYAQFPGLPEDGLTATFQRHRALGREDMAFLTWEHPMVSGALDLIINTELGNSAFCTLETDAFAAGTLLLEANFTLQCVAAGQQAISRFLPQRFQRLLVDANGRQHQQTLPANQFNKLAGRIPRATAQELIRHAREQIDVLLKQAQKAAAPLAEEIKSQALQSLQQTMAVETERLNALARVNPAIREAEIEAQAMAVQKMTDTIQSAELRLDAIRVAIVTEPGA